MGVAVKATGTIGEVIRKEGGRVLVWFGGHCYRWYDEDAVIPANNSSPAIQSQKEWIAAGNRG